jgi:hypothetical protein
MLQGQRTAGAPECVFDVDQHFCVAVGAAHVEFGLSLRASAAAASLAKQAFEEIAELGFVKPGAVIFETLIPVGRGPEILPGLPVFTQLVVSCTFFGVLEHFVGFTDLLEAFLGVWLLADVGMKLARQFAVGSLDFIRAGFPRDPENVVIVSKLHGLLSGRWKQGRWFAASGRCYRFDQLVQRAPDRLEFGFEIFPVVFFS